MMRAKMLGFFSGFPARQFPPEIAVRIKEELDRRESLVFISAWPSDAERNDSDAAGMHAMFAQYDMSFRKYDVIDDRTDPAKARRLVRDASCIFLMGGNATKQMQLIGEKNILHKLRESNAVILGVSAGASNMAKHALDIWESHAPYDGIGLADITIKAHIGQDEQELMRTLIKISEEHDIPICAMEDNSAIFVKEDGAESIGHIRWVYNGEARLFCTEMLK